MPIWLRCGRIETQLSAANSAINRATQDKLLLENSLRVAREQLQSAPASAAVTMEAAAKSERLLQLDRQILQLETTLSGLRQQYSDTHPDVRRTVAAHRLARDQRLLTEGGAEEGRQHSCARDAGGADAGAEATAS